MYSDNTTYPTKVWNKAIAFAAQKTGFSHTFLFVLNEMNFVTASPTEKGSDRVTVMAVSHTKME